MNGVAKQMKAMNNFKFPTANISSTFDTKEMVNLNNLKTKLTMPSANAIPGNHTPPPVSVAFYLTIRFPVSTRSTSFALTSGCINW